MKTILTQSRESTKLLRKIKISFAVLLVFFIAFVIVKMIYIPLFLENYDSFDYSTNKEVFNLFSENETEFNIVADIIVDKDVLNYVYKKFCEKPSILIPSGDSLKEPSSQLKNQTILSKDEYILIHNFFDKYGPVCIDKTEFAELRFVFWTQEAYVYLVYKCNSETNFEYEFKKHNESWGFYIVPHNLEV